MIKWFLKAFFLYLISLSSGIMATEDDMEGSTTTEDLITTTEEVMLGVVSSPEGLPVKTCVINHRDVCFFNSLHINDTHPYFVAKSDVDPLDVTKVDLGGNLFEWRSKVHTLVAIICDTFPNIRKYRAVHLGLQKIHANAFQNCEDADTINLSYNQLRWLDPSLFEHNQQLKRVELEKNQLNVIDPNLFQHLSKLTILTLNGNQLKYFPLKEMRSFEKLRMIDISNNKEMKDIDEYEIIKKFPNLMKILLCDSKNITTSRMQTIFKVLNAKNIKTREAGRCNHFFSNVQELEDTRSLLPVHTPDVDIETGLPIYKCYMTINYYGEDPCLFSGLELDEEHALFVPVSINISSDAVTKVFMKGKIHTLTSDICDTFMNIETFYAYNLEAVAIQPNAFRNCRKLEKLDIKHNPVTELDDTLFQYNTNLKKLNVEGLRLKRLDPKLLADVSSLEVLNLSDNDLFEFPIKKMPKMKNLRLLLLEYNKFKDLEEEEVVKHFPGLKMITICENSLNKEKLFTNEKMEKMRLFFREHDIRMECAPLMPIDEIYQFI